ncbi:sterol-sensing domain of SREBP cleavage-activation-domain-containing protein [Echria macrotheca]|uniref:Sterol regulatory element-binding protein cleavage-activating protein n=1 Tax=Echria macrotheca TaxID=438768 RepID=A0AAJ0BBL5_9PEZI|nr:sterol-sensing domain of SREBP cleavage-activation-domain-containing protein [Echria macrotheca]
MLWYLLYPLRGTTEAPVLSPTHPLRAAFSRYGTWAARHVQTVLPLSTAVVFVFLYLFPYLYTTDTTNITSGASTLPHHVWTDAQPLRVGADVEPDVIMRSIWVHGSYMKALDRNVLLGALELQDELLGPTTDFNPRRPANSTIVTDLSADLNRNERDSFHIVNGLTDRSWFFHSPLQYWSGSASNIADDPDIISTVNAKKTQSTSVNVTLRHSIVFSGKRFEERRLVAADALVITLIHRRDSPVGEQWVRKAEALASRPQDKWTIIPEDGRSMSSQLYEFQFRPMSWSDLTLLSIAYSLVIVYLMLSLSRVHAVKSRLGLVLTIICQIAASIMSSFTVCAIFKVDLSRIPSYAYPLVILAVSVENCLRLINAVIMTSSSISISARIGEAFGATAHVAVANRLQNLLILLGLSSITLPGVAAFCRFAAVAVVFDFFYMATFFLSVLSVDVRQRELSDLEKASVRRKKTEPPSNPGSTWADNLRRVRFDEVGLSTRVAGSIVILGFVLIAQSHYSPESGRQWLNQVLGSSWSATPITSPKSSLLMDIHQARSPTSWLRLQDHETAREVINVIKPWAHSYVALVHDPIIFLLKGSNRIPPGREPYFLPAVYDFVHHEIPRFMVVLIMFATMMNMFTRRLLRAGYKQPGDPEHPEDEPLLSVQALSRDHSLDVEMMKASPGGLLVSIGLDRVIQIWDVPSGTRSRVLVDVEIPHENPFPVLGVAIHDASRQLALVSRDKVLVWEIEKQQWGSAMKIELGDHKPEAVFFGSKKNDPAPPLVVVRKNGTMVELQPELGDLREYVVCKTALTLAVPFVETCRSTIRHPSASILTLADCHPSSTQQTSRMSILTASRKSCVHLVRRDETGWTSREVKFVGREMESKGVHALIPIPAFSMYLVARSHSVDLVDLDSSSVIHTFETEPMQPRTLKHIVAARAQPNELAALTLSYINSETRELVIHTYLPEEEGDSIYTYNIAGTRRGRPSVWAASREIRRYVSNPGTWEALSNGSIVGVRRQKREPATTASPTSRLRHLGIQQTDVASSLNEADEWEAWVMNHPEAKGDFETRSLDCSPLDPALELKHGGLGQLMISKLGPMVKLGAMSVAVGFGNVIKLISVGHEHFDGHGRLDAAVDMRNMMVRRRRTMGSARMRSQ